MMPLSHRHESPPPPPLPPPLDPASPLAGVGLPFLIDPFLEAAWLVEGVTCPDVGLTVGVCCGSTQAKEQRFLMILVLGLGERSLHRSSSWLIH